MHFKKRHINPSDNTPVTPEHSASQTPLPAEANWSAIKTKSPSGKRKKISWFFIFLIILFTLIGAIVSADNNSFLGGVKNNYIVRQIANIISSSGQHLRGEKDDRINFLLLGMGGEGHDGPYLTDTIILASFKPSTKEAALFSIPRDMIVPIAPGDYRKINSVYTLGQQNKQGGGEFTKKVVSDALGLPIHYFVAVDFEGFVRLIDALGGVDIKVDKSFVDQEFPTADDKWQMISFKEGEQEMNGLTALRFARSRHGNNGEGSDFARIKRQQKILLSAKDKITSFSTLINPHRISSLFSLFTKYTQTDLEPWEAVKLINMSKGIDTQKIITQSIDDRPGGYLKSGIAMDGAYILQPTTGNYEQIKKIIFNIFDLGNVSLEKAKIVVQNGTALPGLAIKAVNYLTQMGYNVIKYGNAVAQDKISTTIYAYNDTKPKTKESLEKIFQTKSQAQVPLDYSSSVVASQWDIKDQNGKLENLDFLVILGMDQAIDESAQIIPTIDPSLLASSTATSTPTSTIPTINQ